jgi:lysophospholipase L1-like esterase
MPRLIQSLAWCLLLAGGVRSVPAAPEPFAFKSRETVVFFGDSITFGGLYAIYVESCLRTRHPGIHWRFVNAGMSSETVSGLSEKDHPGPRPNALDRFDRDVAAVQPTLVVACFGMNDGIYAPLDQRRFAKYRAGIGQLIERTHALGARLVLLTPPTFDHPKAGTPDEREPDSYGYKAPFHDYDQVLHAYSGWLAGLSTPGVTVIDLHTRMHEHLAGRRRSDPEFTLQPDRVHPNANGHMVMAATLLKAWGVPAVADELVIEAASLKVAAGHADNLRREDATLAFDWPARLPMAFDSRWDEESMTLEGMARKLNRHTLTIKGLPAGDYRLVAGGEVVAFLGGHELAAGVDLLQLKKFPTNQRAALVLQFLDERRKLEQKLKRHPPSDPGEVDSERQRARDIDDRVAQLARPAPIALQIEPAR